MYENVPSLLAEAKEVWFADRAEEVELGLATPEERQVLEEAHQIAVKRQIITEEAEKSVPYPDPADYYPADVAELQRKHDELKGQLTPLNALREALFHVARPRSWYGDLGEALGVDPELAEAAIKRFENESGFGDLRSQVDELSDKLARLTRVGTRAVAAMNKAHDEFRAKRGKAVAQALKQFEASARVIRTERVAEEIRQQIEVRKHERLMEIKEKITAELKR